MVFNNFETLNIAFATKQLHPQDLKNGIIEFISNFLEPIRQKFSTKEMITLTKQAYP